MSQLENEGMEQEEPVEEPAEEVVEAGAEDDEAMEEAEAPENEKASGMNPVVRELLSWVMIFVGAFLVAYILTNFIIVNARIPSGSMETTINIGDKVVGFRLSYLFDEPQRGEIVMFNSPVEEGKIYIKRVIGLPGDTIEIKNNTTYVNGEELEEDYVKNGWLNNPGETIYQVPEGCYFMMGDNRDGSSDSRMWGYVEEDEIIAKAIFRYWPSITMLD